MIETDDNGSRREIESFDLFYDSHGQVFWGTPAIKFQFHVQHAWTLAPLFKNSSEGRHSLE